MQRTIELQEEISQAAYRLTNGEVKGDMPFADQIKLWNELNNASAALGRARVIMMPSQEL